MNTADESAIIGHFSRCDPDFIRLLDVRVERVEYARKIAMKSARFEAWSGESLVGLVAVYFGTENLPSAHISNVSVTIGHTAMGIASVLLQQCIESAIRRGAGRITLEVAKTNTRAGNLYARFGFRKTGENGEFLMMECIPPRGQMPG
jgi:ribosomal protein S18 acetylase RimI-like enzyme